MMATQVRIDDYIQIEAFIKGDGIQRDAGSMVSLDDLHTRYLIWCRKTNAQVALTRILFSKALVGMGYLKHRKTEGIVFLGLAANNAHVQKS
jgi:hypothetical protein